MEKESLTTVAGVPTDCANGADQAGSQRARLQLVSAMLIFGTIGVFTRYIPLPSGEIALYRGILAILCVGAFLAVSRQGWPSAITKSDVWWLLLSGAAIGINWVLLFQAYANTTVSLATLSYYFAPTLVTIASAVFFRERLGARQIVCFLMATLGLVLIVGSGEMNGASNGVGIFYGLGAAVFYATVVLLNKQLRHVPGVQRTVLQFIAAVIVATPYVALTDGFHVATLHGVGLICMLVLGIVHTGFAYCIYFSSLPRIPGQTVAVLSYLDPLLAVILSVVILQEPITLVQCLGGALILGFALWNEIK